MHISWLGGTAFKLQVKSQGEDVTIVIDPYKAKTGTMPRSMTPDIALFTRTAKNALTLSGTPFVLDTAGECDVKGVLVIAVEGADAEHTMLRIDAEHMSVGHLGLTKATLNDRQQEVLSGVDILLVPCGNKESYDAEAAVKMVNQLEPRITIPYAFKSDIDPQAKPVSGFVKEIGVAAETPEKKIVIKRKDLPQEDMRVIVLTKE